ncbi:MAG: hypothetical protein AAF570_18380, partial [Bacteroidota bacterium]
AARSVSEEKSMQRLKSDRLRNLKSAEEVAVRQTLDAFSEQRPGLEAEVARRLEVHWRAAYEALFNTERFKAGLIQYEHLKTLGSEFENICERYSRAVQGLLDGLKSILTNSLLIHTELQQSSDQIKQDAIEPSFQLLKDTEGNLSSAEQKFLEVSFA